MRILIAAVSLSLLSFLATACETTERQPEAPAVAETTTVATTAAAQPVAAAIADQGAPAAGDECGGGACGGGGSCGGSCGGGGSCAGKACGCEAAMATRAPRNVPSDAVWTEVAVKGMRCGGCEKRIEAALAGLDGVYDVDANHEHGSVRIAAAPTDREVRTRVVPQIEALGFRTR